MEKVLQGCHVVVSTVFKGQLDKVETGTVHAAKKAGVSLFVPFQFGVDLDRFGDSHPVYQFKAKVIEVTQKVGLPVLKVHTGFFSDMIFDVLADSCWEFTFTPMTREKTTPTRHGGSSGWAIHEAET